jgi:hypothetical protein
VRRIAKMSRPGAIGGSPSSLRKNSRFSVDYHVE